MRRLYLQIYVAVLGVLLLFAILIGVASWRLDADPTRRTLDDWARFAEAVLPPPEASPERLSTFCHALAEPFDANLSIYGAQGRLLARVGRPLPPPPEERRSQWRRHGPGRRGAALALSDGRWLLIDFDRRRGPVPHLLIAIALLAAATAIVAYPLARRLTRRLESLRGHVDALGAGQLGARVPVEGRDEIAELAQAFNRTAARIEALVADKTRLLAQTSHELRTPLARVRMALALLGDAPRPELLERIDHDVEELDELIGELLVASRLDAPEQRPIREPVDLLALVAEEAARLESVEVRGEPASVRGDPRLLRRLVRNLLENAIRHGEPPVEVVLAMRRGAEPGKRTIRLIVRDGGPGVPESERERIFEPFYRPAGQASADGGIGLGLALVRQIAERHGGEILCEPDDPGGTRFVLELPSLEE
jgi:signal transduction histidine kinase